MESLKDILKKANIENILIIEENTIKIIKEKTEEFIITKYNYNNNFLLFLEYRPYSKNTKIKEYNKILENNNSKEIVKNYFNSLLENKNETKGLMPIKEKNSIIDLVKGIIEYCNMK